MGRQNNDPPPVCVRGGGGGIVVGNNDDVVPNKIISIKQYYEINLFISSPYGLDNIYYIGYLHSPQTHYTLGVSSVSLPHVGCDHPRPR